MYVCACVCVSTCVHERTRARCVLVFECVRDCASNHICAFVRVCLHVRVHAYVRAYARVLLCVCQCVFRSECVSACVCLKLLMVFMISVILRTRFYDMRRYGMIYFLIKYVHLVFMCLRMCVRC